jgi:hypothetical protein
MKVALTSYGDGRGTWCPPEDPNLEQGWEWVGEQQDPQELMLMAPDSWTPASSSIEVRVLSVQVAGVSVFQQAGAADRFRFTHPFSGSDAEREAQGPVWFEEAAQAACAELGIERSAAHVGGTWGYPKEAGA